MKTPDRWMTVAEIADYLQISRAKIYAMAQAREIPCTKVAGQWRFKRDEIDRWMQAQAPRRVRQDTTKIKRRAKSRGVEQ